METALQTSFQGVVSRLAEIFKCSIGIETKVLRKGHQGLRDKRIARKSGKGCLYAGSDRLRGTDRVRKQRTLRKISGIEGVRGVVIGTQMRRVLANIRYICNQVSCDFMLNFQAPILN